ncbi:MAG: hypothetical protein A2516_02490 [Alphaproteobacteria bacterium RIFOXYD12_FULL_60_8]|nr:MAG: hypothetical protein A2516_02490 [Alphaproteobacteria bacterium RIFOXYD12_FULL_60_8]
MQSLFRTDNITRQFIFYNVLIITPFSLLFLMYQVARIFGVDDIIMPGLVYNGINELFTFVGALILVINMLLLLRFLFRSHFLRGYEPSSLGFEDSSTLASMERKLASETETIRETLEKRIRALESQLDKNGSEDISSVTERVVTAKVSELIGSDIVGVIGKGLAAQATDYAKRVNLLKTVTDLFNTSHTRIKDHAVSAEKTAQVYRRMGMLLAWAGIILAGINLLVFYNEILSGGGGDPLVAPPPAARRNRGR